MRPLRFILTATLDRFPSGLAMKQNLLKFSSFLSNSSISSLKHQLDHLWACMNTSFMGPLWRPYLIKDIENFKRIQRRVTKFILNDCNLDYKSRLIQCKILPLMYFFELTDILFFVKSVKSPSSAFNIFNYVTFNISSTRLGYFSKLLHNITPTSYTRHFYFNRIVRLWNSLPFIDLHLSFYVIKAKLYDYF